MRPVTRPTIRSASRSARRVPGTRRAVSVACVSVGLLGSAAGPALASTYSVTDLGSLGYGTTYATAINASGQITGESYLATEVQVGCPTRHDKPPCFTHPGHAFLWSKGSMTDLGTLGGLDSAGTAINDLGEVVGTTGTSNGTEAFTDQSGVMTVINSGDPAAINDSGVIVGQGPSGAVIDNGGTLQNLNRLIPAGSGFTLTNATAVNNSGQIVAQGSNNTTGQNHGFLLIPS
jgi:uncharacterized membrane protein